MSDEEDVDRIAAEIMAYLEQRPLASDSLEGIVHWWLLRQSVMHNKTLVERALEKLDQQGRVVKQQANDREPVYRIGPANRQVPKE